eukprot:scaffold241377_cov37-Prasinocladus_malaysianus.AAC.1
MGYRGCESVVGQIQPPDSFCDMNDLTADFASIGLGTHAKHERRLDMSLPATASLSITVLMKIYHDHHNTHNLAWIYAKL